MNAPLRPWLVFYLAENRPVVLKRSLTEAPINCEDREGSRLLSSALPRPLVYRNQSVGAGATRINSFRSVNARARVHRFIDLVKDSPRACASRRHRHRDFLCSHGDDTAPTSFTSNLYTSKCNHYSFDRRLSFAVAFKRAIGNRIVYPRPHLITKTKTTPVQLSSMNFTLQCDHCRARSCVASNRIINKRFHTYTNLRAFYKKMFLNKV